AQTTAPSVRAARLTFKPAERVVGLPAPNFQQEPVIAAVQINAPQFVRPRRSGAELVGLVMPTAAAAALSRVNDKSPTRDNTGSTSISDAVGLLVFPARSMKMLPASL